MAEEGAEGDEPSPGADVDRCEQPVADVPTCERHGQCEAGVPRERPDRDTEEQDRRAAERSLRRVGNGGRNVGERRQARLM
jgi:hypothetical protein